MAIRRSKKGEMAFNYNKRQRMRKMMLRKVEIDRLVNMNDHLWRSQ